VQGHAVVGNVGNLEASCYRACMDTFFAQSARVRHRQNQALQFH